MNTTNRFFIFSIRALFNTLGHGSGHGNIVVEIVFFPGIRMKDMGDPAELIIGIGGLEIVLIFKVQGQIVNPRIFVGKAGSF